jgi:hypothetical protein
MRSSLCLLSSAVVALASGCEQQAPMVYVPEAPQEVILTASASASKVQPGGTVLLHAQRHTSGRWKQIPRDQLRPGQCWMYRPPAQSEAEVADNVEWEIAPKHAVRLNTEFRMDHTRLATVMTTGTITLTPLSAVPCEPDRVIKGPTIQIEATS